MQCILIDEDCNELERVKDSPNPYGGVRNFMDFIQMELRSIFKEKSGNENAIKILNERYPWLNSIDEYGNTYVNNLQVPHFIRELEQLKAETDNGEVKDAVDQCIVFLQKITNHVYVKFEGD